MTDTRETLQRYKHHRPTGFDPTGAFLPERQEWFLAPVSRTRDSGPLDESNFHAALALLGGEGEGVEVHRFGHWGPGWYEIILVDPQDQAKVDKAEELYHLLADYPVLDDEDFSRREDEACASTWEHCFDERTRAEYLRAHVSRVYPLSGETVYTMLRQAVKGSWYHAANMLPCPSDLIG